MSFGVVIAAAGQGKRMGSSEKKQFIQLQNKSVLYHSVQLFKAIPQIKEIVVVTNREDIARTKELLYDLAPITVIPGGEERQESVFLGLKALQHVPYVLIHDAARPFSSQDLIKRVMNKAMETGAAIPAVPVKDTIKVVDEKREVVNTPPRQSLWAVQTPQAFRLSSIMDAHQRAEKAGFIGTDDSMLMEWQEQKVAIVEGEYTNVKLTTPEDLKLGESILEQRRR